MASNPTRGLAAVLACSLACSPLAAQAPGPSPTKLKIVILDGDEAINYIRQRTAKEPIVQVQDESDRPVLGAVVMFTLPDRGASGVFANGATSMTVTTNPQGIAAGTGLRPNTVAGQFHIRVDASYQGQRASAALAQTNSLAPISLGGGAGKAVAIVALIGGAAGAGAVVAMRRKNASPGSPSAPPAPQTSVAIGAPTVGPPR